MRINLRLGNLVMFTTPIRCYTSTLNFNAMRKQYPLKLLALLIMMVPFALYGQTTVSGKVTDAGSGSALPGVGVVVVGTTTGTSTDVNGNYSITLPSDEGR